MSQIKGQFLKKFLSSLRAWVLFIIQNVIPIFFVVMTFVIVRSISRDQDLPPLTMSLEPYKETVTVVEGTPDTFGRVQAFEKLFEKINGEHRLDVITTDMNDYILKRVS